MKTIKLKLVRHGIETMLLPNEEEDWFPKKTLRLELEGDKNNFEGMCLQRPLDCYAPE